MDRLACAIALILAALLIGLCQRARLPAREHQPGLRKKLSGATVLDWISCLCDIGISSRSCAQVQSDISRCETDTARAHSGSPGRCVRERGNRLGFTRTLTAEQSKTFSSRVLCRDPLMAVLPRSPSVKSQGVRIAYLANESFVLFHRGLPRCVRYDHSHVSEGRLLPAY